METTLDRFGRVVIPKKVRSRLGVEAGTVFEIEESDGEIHLKPILETPVIVEKGGILVHRGRPAGSIEDAVNRDREDRIRKIMPQEWR